jgi:ribonuclease-3
MANDNKLFEFETKLQYIFNDKSLLKMALTHKSYAYENVNNIKKTYNERIEFLGDAILEHIISDLLYNHQPNFTEGEMSKKRAAIVREESLSQAMKRIGAQEYIYLGKCERTTNGKMKDAIIADAFEAVLGAIYLDGGYDVAKNIALELLDEEIKIVLSGKELNIDYKTKLQEKLQKHGTVKIEYMLDNEYGLEHDKTFEVSVYLNQVKIGSGTGKNKKQAEQMAAKCALESGKKN